MENAITPNEIKNLWLKINESAQKVTKSREQAIVYHIFSRLKELGFEFTHDDLFFAFLKERITRHTFNEPGKTTHYLTLDFNTPQEKRLGGYIETTTQIDNMTQKPMSVSFENSISFF